MKALASAAFSSMSLRDGLIYNYLETASDPAAERDFLLPDLG